MNSTLIQFMGLRKPCPNCIRSQRVINQSVTVVMYVRCRCQETTRLCGSGSGCVTRPWVPLWPLLMSIHGVAFTVTDGTIYFSLHLVEVTRTIHIIAVTLLHSVCLVTVVVLLPSPISHLSHGHVRYIVLPLIHQPLRQIKQRLKSGLPCLLLST
jgi:hypothetical protein